jgi:dCMP deaminase
MNAIAFAAKRGLSTEGSQLYITHAPCHNCAKLLINAGVTEVHYGHEYRSDAGLALLAEAGVMVYQTQGVPRG